MKKHSPWALWLAATMAAAAAAFAPVALAAPAAAPHAHDHGHAATPALQLDHGRKWASDAPLREGIGRIRAAVAPQLARKSTMGPEEAAALAARIEGEVGAIVANCKLPPQADAMLHTVLGELMAGTGTLAGRTPGADRTRGLHQVAAAINDYGRIFEHPGFRPLPAGH